MKVLVVGGRGDFGSYYAKLLKKNNFDVFISGRNYSEVEEERVSEMDCVIVSVPNEDAPLVIDRISKKMARGSLLADLCSVKSHLIKVHKKAAKRGLEVASIHPMHGPRVSTISNYPVPVIEVSKGNKLEKIINFFKSEKANVFFTTYKEHDEMLSIVQGLTHFAQFVSAETLKELCSDIKSTKRFASPNYELFLSLMSRVVTQNPELYSQIQTENPKNELVRKIFVKKSKELFSAAKKGSLTLQKKIEDEAKMFSSFDELLFSGDKAVSALKFVENTLVEKKGEKVLLENVITKRFHYGVIKDICSDELVFEEGKEVKKIALPKIRLGTEKELLEWKRNNILEKKLDFSFLIPKSAEKGCVAEAFDKINEARIIGIEEYESEKLPVGMKSITLKTSIFTDEDIERTKKQILKKIEGLGYKPR